MNIFYSLLVALGLSMDNLAVTVTAGCALRSHKASLLWQVSILFALAHFAMFALGFEGGVLVHFSQSVGPWIACAILVVIGGRMIQNACTSPSSLKPGILDSIKTQLALAVATSLDALFVGAGLGITHAPFWQTQLALVGCVLVTSLCGFYLGSYLGKKFGRLMEKIGGGILILLGVKLLLETKGIW